MNDTIKNIIALEHRLVRHGKIAPPHLVADIIAELAVRLSELIEPYTELRYALKQKKAERFNRLAKERSINQAEILVRHDEELAKLEVSIERVENWIRRTETVISTMQTYIKVKTQEAQSNL